MKLHTTHAGDQFLIDHIQSTTKWSENNRHREAKPSKLPRLFTICGSFALAALVFLTLLILL